MKQKLLATIFATVALKALPASATSPETTLAEDAYIYGYSIDKAYTFFYHTVVEDNYPLNRFQNLRTLADDSYTAHPTVNNDTLHLMGWLDLAAEPVIVSVPDMDEGRYWILHTMDMGHYTNAAFGSRTRGSQGGQFMFAPKNWQGKVPDSVDEVIRSESNLVKLMGRIMALGGQDTNIALNYMDQWNIRTLSEYLGTNGPRPLQRNYPNPMTSTWLERVNYVLCDGTMANADKQWLDKYRPVGIEPCKTDFTPRQQALARLGEKAGMKRLEKLAPTLSDARKILGTRETLSNTERDIFAVGSYLGQWGLPPIEASYRKADFDLDGQKLDGSKHDYVMRFKAPNVSEFWSITIYSNDNRLMAANDIKRYSRGDRTLQADEEGYYTIYMSTKTQGRANDPNFLPIPAKPFYAVMRLYGADDSIQSGKYKMPVLTPAR